MVGDIHLIIQIIIHLIGAIIPIIHIVMDLIMVDMVTGDTMTIIIRDITHTAMETTTVHIIIKDIHMGDLVTTNIIIVACRTALHTDIAAVIQGELTAGNQMRLQTIQGTEVGVTQLRTQPDALQPGQM
jgi:hypothetical protein